MVVDSDPMGGIVELHAASRRLIWRSAQGLVEGAVDSPDEIEWGDALPVRETARYPHRSNTDGLYWCAQLDQHIYFESLLEKQALMFLDHAWDLSAIVAQPFEIRLDGTRHTPDFLVTTSDGHRVVVNVKPSTRMTDSVVSAFERLEGWADSVGWAHHLHHELPDVEERNLRWVSGYRATRHAPDGETRARLLRIAAAGQRSLQDLCNANLADAKKPTTLAATYHLLWRRDLALARPGELLSMKSEVIARD